MKKLMTATAVAALMIAMPAAVSPALADHGTVTVNLGGISAELATALGIDESEVPASVDVSLEIAAVVCEDDSLSDGDTCDATISSDDLTDFLDEDDDDDDGAGSENSAREFAPGQQDGPAKEFAPGQQEGDAKDSAPGQQKKADDGGDDSDDDDDDDDSEEGGSNGGGQGNSKN